VAYQLGDYFSARALQDESLIIRRELGDRRCIAESLEGDASLAVVLGATLHAARLWGAAERIREEFGAALPVGERPPYEQRVSAARASIGDNAAWQEGRAVTMELAIELALAGAQQ